MKQVFVITGGTGGMGLATAEILSHDVNNVIVLADVRKETLDSAKEKFADNGAQIETFLCDIS